MSVPREAEAAAGQAPGEPLDTGLARLGRISLALPGSALGIEAARAGDRLYLGITGSGSRWRNVLATSGDRGMVWLDVALKEQAGKARAGFLEPTEPPPVGSALCLFRGRRAPRPVLLTGALHAAGCVLARTAEPLTLVPLARPGAEHLERFEQFLCVGERLYAVGRRPGRLHATELLVTDDPVLGSWSVVERFEKADSLDVTHLFRLGTRLHAVTSSAVRGFEVWARDGEGASAWERVLEQGAWAHAVSPAVRSLAVWRGAAYLGTASADARRRSGRLPPLGAEVLRLQHDGRFDLLVGRSRFTPRGLKLPLGARGPGFDRPERNAIGSLAVWDDELFAVSFEESGRRPRLWASPDGLEWAAVDLSGLGEPAVSGLFAVRSLAGSLYLFAHEAAPAGRGRTRARGGAVQVYGTGSR